MAILINNVKNNETIMVKKEHQNIKQYKNLKTVLNLNNINIINTFDKFLIINLDNANNQYDLGSIWRSSFFNKKIKTEAQKSPYFILKYGYNIADSLKSLFNKIRFFVILPCFFNIISLIVLWLKPNIIQSNQFFFLILSLSIIFISIMLQIISVKSFNKNTKIPLNFEKFFKNFGYYFLYFIVTICNGIFLFKLKDDLLFICYFITTIIASASFFMLFNWVISLFFIEYYDVIYKISCDKNDKIIFNIIGIIPIKNQLTDELKKHFTNDSENKISIAMEDYIVQSYINNQKII